MAALTWELIWTVRASMKASSVDLVLPGVEPPQASSEQHDEAADRNRDHQAAAFAQESGAMERFFARSAGRTLLHGLGADSVRRSLSTR